LEGTKKEPYRHAIPGKEPGNKKTVGVHKSNNRNSELRRRNGEKGNIKGKKRGGRLNSGRYLIKSGLTKKNHDCKRRNNFGQVGEARDAPVWDLRGEDEDLRSKKPINVKKRRTSTDSGRQRLLYSSKRGQYLWNRTSCEP